MHARTHAHTHTHTRTFTCTRAHTHTHIDTHLHTCTIVHTYTQSYTVHIYTTYTAGDITRNDYELEFYYNRSLVEYTLYFHWLLSEKAVNMMSSQFITGFHVTIEILQPDYHNNLTSHSMETKNLSLNVTMETTSIAVMNITLEPNQRYLLIGRILTKDNNTWRPEAVHMYFEIPVAGNYNN